LGIYSTNGILPAKTSRNFGNFESARYKVLENTLRIVLLRSGLHLLHVLYTVAGQRVLGDVCVIEVQVRVVGTDAYSIGTYPVN
jgi:hypothetical protein